MSQPTPPDDIRLSAALLGAIEGSEPRMSRSLADVQAAIARGEGPVLVELPWRERTPEGEMPTHQVLVTALNDSIVRFINPRRSPAPVGTTLGGAEAGPLRVVEPGGEESIARPAFEVLWMMGGTALLPGEPSQKP